MINNQTLSCGHPIQAASEMLPDFFGDTPATQKIGTVYCRWCNDVARAEAKVNELEHRIRRALNELGIPQAGYPAPVANAVSVLRGE
jgi:hypothetical protein